MLAQNRSNTQNCASGITGFDFEANNINAIFVVNLDGKQKDLIPFQIALDKRVEDLKAIFRLNTVRIMSYDEAKSILDFWFI